MQSLSEQNLWGIDVSHHQGDIDWPTVRAAGVVYAFIKATEGIGVIDDKFGRNATEANAVGLSVGYYHYAHPELNPDPIREVEAFLAAIEGQTCDMPLVLDVEGAAHEIGVPLDAKAKLTAWCLTWLTEVQRRTGKPVMIYSGGYYAKTYLGQPLGQFPLWIAHYGQPEAPLANDMWDRWAVWQVSDNGGCPGIPAGTCDTNMMEADFYWELTKPADFPQLPESPQPILSADDANKIIGFLAAAYGATADPEAREEFHRLANELRKASGQAKQ